MSQSLAKIYIHLVFSTKGRADTIPKANLEEGYGAFSVSNSHVDAVVAYIKGQEEHHKKVSFQDELRRICELYNVNLDERYAWD